jgi:arginine/lysine/ornithine decarboxylase
MFTLRIYIKEFYFMAAPLYEALVKYKLSGRSSFHTPGHKNSPEALPENILGLDYTELPETGSLFDGTSPFAEAEELAARLFGTARTCFSAGGCTLCIQAMLRLALPNGGKMLCSRVIHRSAVNTMALLGIEPLWAMPQDICAALAEAPDVRAVYITSPDYYGRITDVSRLSEACRQRKLPLLVDCAHGTQLMFTKPRLHPLLFGASMTADSAHKTLGVLTGGAWLNIADGRFARGAKEAMALFGSTSPSYPVMASLDICREMLQEGKLDFEALQERTARVKKLAAGRGITMPAGLTDPTRITLDTASVGIKGTDAAEFLRQNGVEPEYADSAFVILIATPFNTEADFIRLEQAVGKLPVGKPLNIGAELPPLPPVKASLREAVLAEHEYAPLESAAGMTAAEAVCPCPPGIPVIMPGEIITPDVIPFLRSYGFSEIKVLK